MRIGNGEIGRLSGCQGAPFQPQQAGGSHGEGGDQPLQRDFPGMMQGHGGGEQGFQSDRPGLRFGERQTFGVGALRIVTGHDHVDESFRQSRGQCGAILLAAHWPRDWRKDSST